MCLHFSYCLAAPSLPRRTLQASSSPSPRVLSKVTSILPQAAQMRTLNTATSGSSMVPARGRNTYIAYIAQRITSFVFLLLRKIVQRHYDAPCPDKGVVG